MSHVRGAPFHPQTHGKIKVETPTYPGKDSALGDQQYKIDLFFNKLQNP